MAWAPDYVTTAELKSWLRIGDTADDALLAFAVTAASRAVDRACGRQFGSVTPAAVRRYTWDGGEETGRPVLWVDDVHSVTGLAVAVDDDGDGTADRVIVNGTDFDLGPANAAADGRPWNRLVLRRSPAYTFPRWPRGVSVTALFGWAAVPSEVKQAALIQAARLFARRNAPFGVAGSPELGSELRLLERLDPDLAPAVAHLVRPWAAV